MRAVIIISQSHTDRRVDVNCKESNNGSITYICSRAFIQNC